MKKQRMLRGYGEIFCCVLLIAALFAGCALPGLSPDRRRHPSPVLTESETETADTEPAETVPAEPVVRYAPVGKDVFFASVYEGPSGIVLIVLEPGDEDESDTGSSFVRRTSRTLLIYDPLWGRCTGMLALPFSATLSDHIYEDGTFSITDTDSSGGSVCSFYDALGRKKGSFSFDDASSFFVSSDKRSAYFAARHLMRKDLATGNIEMVPLPASMQVSDIREMLPDSDRLLLTLFTEPYGSDTCTGLFDPDTGELLKRNRSPKRGSFYQAFRELYRIRPYLKDPNLSLELLLIDMDEYRLLDGWSRDRKRGSHRYERIPLYLEDRMLLTCPEDYMQLVSPDLPEPFTSAEFAAAAGFRRDGFSTVLLLLTELGAVERTGKKGNAWLYRVREQ